MTDMTKKLDSGEKHFTRLIARDAAADGRTSMSKPPYPLVTKMPHELVEFEPVGAEGRGRARPTAEGASVLRAMEWLS